MVHKRLHELLSEDQEPFLLRSYIDDRRRQLKRQPQTAPLQLKKLEAVLLPNRHGFPIPHDFCQKSLCFFGSQDPSKSPLFELPCMAVAPPKSPCHKNALSLRVPAGTASLLLEAALRIQRSSSTGPPRKWGSGSGIMGSILKRLTRRKSKAVCFERNVDGNDDGASLYVESTSCSGIRGVDVEETMIGCYEKSCKSSFRFEVPECSCSGGRSPEFTSPPVSPKHFGGRNEEEQIHGVERLKGSNSDEGEESEQFSPVSVLDPPFQDDDNDDEDGDSHGPDGGFAYECSYSFVQRKQQLLYKIQRFEKLAKLDPIELEKRVLELDDYDDDNHGVSHDATDGGERERQKRTPELDANPDGAVREVVAICFPELGKTPSSILRLVVDLVAEEGGDSEGRGAAVERVSERLGAWKELGSFTIDMMVEKDLSRWIKPDEEQFGETAKEIEVAVLQFLLEELTQEMLC